MGQIHRLRRLVPAIFDALTSRTAPGNRSLLSSLPRDSTNDPVPARRRRFADLGHLPLPDPAAYDARSFLGGALLDVVPSRHAA